MAKKKVKQIKLVELNPFDLVKVPFKAFGIVREIKNQIWGAKYIVEIIKTNSPFYEAGDVEDFKREQLELVKL